mgnify:CR=1 FL=1
MIRLQALSEAAQAAYLEAVDAEAFHRAIRLKRIATAIDRELDGTAHHPNCECNRCFDQMGDDE